MRSLLVPLVALAASAFLLPGCRSPHRVEDGVFPVAANGSDQHALRFRDGQVSENTTCMIRVANGLNPRIPPAYVNGRPLGFC